MHVGYGVESFSGSKVVHYQRDLCGVSYNSFDQHDIVLQGCLGVAKKKEG